MDFRLAHISFWRTKAAAYEPTLALGCRHHPDVRAIQVAVHSGNHGAIHQRFSVLISVGSAVPGIFGEVEAKTVLFGGS